MQVAARQDSSDLAHLTLPSYLCFPWMNASASSMNSRWDVGDSCRYWLAYVDGGAITDDWTRGFQQISIRRACSHMIPFCTYAGRSLHRQRIGRSQSCLRPSLPSGTPNTHSAFPKAHLSSSSPPQSHRLQTLSCRTTRHTEGIQTMCMAHQ